MRKFCNTDGLSHATIIGLYEQLLNENLELRDNRTELRKELSYKDGLVNSLQSENSKLKERYKK